MKRMITGSFLAATFAVGLSAQTTPPQTPPSTPQTTPQTSRPSSSMDDAKSVTVTGCLKAGSGADSFELSDLKWGSKDTKSPGAVGTSGSGAPTGIGSASTLKIVPSGGAKLSEHVGHTVEVTGSIEGKASGSATSPTPSDPAARPSASASGPTLEAKTVKMVSSTCTP